MNPDAATFWTGITCLALGWVAFWLLVHRPDVKVRNAIHADVIAAKDDTIEALEATVDVLGQSADNALARMIGTNVKYLKTRRELNALRARMDRGVLLPTIEGNYLDTVANLPVGFRLDWGTFDSETPIGLEVVESLAEVVPFERPAR